MDTLSTTLTAQISASLEFESNRKKPCKKGGGGAISPPHSHPPSTMAFNMEYFKQTALKGYEYYKKDGQHDRGGVYPPMPMPRFCSLSWYLVVASNILVGALSIYALYAFALTIDSILHPVCLLDNSCGTGSDELVEDGVSVLQEFVKTYIWAFLRNFEELARVLWSFFLRHSPF